MGSVASYCARKKPAAGNEKVEPAKNLVDKISLSLKCVNHRHRRLKSTLAS